MKQSNVYNIPHLFASILYIIGFLIFLEWLYPIQEVTETNNIHYFIIYAAFCFTLSLLQFKWWQSIPLKGIGMLIFIYLLFFDGSFLEFNWLTELLDDIIYNIKVMMAREWFLLTAVFRSSLFLLLIWLMSYLIHYWFIIVKRAFLFITLTFIYLTVLDTFTAYDAGFSIIRVFILSFIALGMTNFFKEVQHESISFAWMKKSVKWLMPILSIVLLSALIGYLAPKAEPQWPDPMPFIENATGTMGLGGSGERKVGYGEDDSQLGGSFVQDDQKVFQAIASKPHYWRIETRDVYTGKGWETSPEEQTTTTQSQIPLSTFSDDVETETHQAVIRMEDDVELPKLVYPYGIEEVKAEGPADFVLDERTEEIRTKQDGADIYLETYALMYELPSFNVDDLKASGSDPEDIKERYTQLPENLPENISELAEEITEPYTNRYEKAVAIENYFGQSGDFEYQTDLVPIPGENQDYVEQFLFDSQVGYCDNYSTSMVVMLRTLGIPARWAKGFTSGEDITDEVDEEVAANGYNVYEVTNANAHSWPEVYFPDIGWVPFEPTQGFSNLADFHLDVEGTDDEALEVPDNEEPENEDEEASLDDEVEEDEEASAAVSSDDDSEQFYTFKTWHLIPIAILFIIILLFLYMKRHRIKAYRLEKKMQKNEDAASYQAAYQFLLRLLNHKGYGKNPQQTLREYAKEIDVLYTTRTMGRLTYEYEQLIYNQGKKNLKNSEFPQLWKDFIQQVTS